MKAYESARDNFRKLIHQFQPETKTHTKKLKRIMIKLYRQNVSSLFNQTYIYIYIYIYIYEPKNCDQLEYYFDVVHVLELPTSYTLKS